MRPIVPIYPRVTNQGCRAAPRTLCRVSAKRRATGPAQTRKPQPRRTPKQRAAKVAKVLAIVGVVGALVLAGVVVVLYQAISIPTPNSAFQAQTTFVYYADGERQLGTYYEDQNRESIPLDELKYWSVERQEPYINADASLSREIECNPGLRRRGGAS